MLLSNIASGERGNTPADGTMRIKDVDVVLNASFNELPLGSTKKEKAW